MLLSAVTWRWTRKGRKNGAPLSEANSNGGQQAATEQTASVPQEGNGLSFQERVGKPNVFGKACLEKETLCRLTKLHNHGLMSTCMEDGASKKRTSSH